MSEETTTTERSVTTRTEGEPEQTAAASEPATAEPATVGAQEHVELLTPGAKAFADDVPSPFGLGTPRPAIIYPRENEPAHEFMERVARAEAAPDAAPPDAAPPAKPQPEAS